MKINTLSTMINKVIFISLPVAYTFFSESMTVFSKNSATVLGHPQPWQLGFQTPAAPIAEGIIAFHDDLMVFLTFILFFVIVILSTCLYTFTETKKNGESDPLVHASTLEIVWTLIPAIILIIIAIPSFSLLYSVDEIVEPLLTLKIIGHQWYWSYEFFNAETLSQLLSLEFKTEYESISTFDSYMLSDEDIANNVGLTSYRLYTVDKHVGLPSRVPTRLLMTSNDVLHSWTVPSLGVKVDACPGRLNQSSLYIKYSGIYYGQCSEICGTNHAFMPIGIVSFDLGLPLYVLEDVFSDLEPIIISLQTQGEAINDFAAVEAKGNLLGAGIMGYLSDSVNWIGENPITFIAYTVVGTVGVVGVCYVAGAVITSVTASTVGTALTGTAVVKTGAVVTTVVTAKTGAVVTGVVAAKTGAVVAAPGVITGAAKLMKIIYVEKNSEGPSMLFVQYFPTGPIFRFMGNSLGEVSLTLSQLLNINEIV